MWLPAVCRKMDIPYCIVKSKSRLGALVHQKTATALALTSVRSEVRAAATPPASRGLCPAYRRHPESREHSSPGRTTLTPRPGHHRRVLPAHPLTPSSSSALQDRHEFSQLVTAIRQQYNENAKAIERGWGGGIMGVKSQAATSKTEKALAKEMAKKAMM